MVSLAHKKVSTLVLFNDYFLDFLEPTFGDSLDVDIKSFLQNPIIFSTFPIYKQYQMSILYNHSHQKHNIKIHYI